MSRYASQQAAGTVVDGDRGFRGVDMRREPELLEAGMLAEAVNARCVRGVAETRRGMTPVSWVRSYATEFPLVFPLVFDLPVASTLGTVYGVSAFTDPTSVDYLLIATEDSVYFCADHAVPVRTLYPDGVTVTGPVDMVQAFDRVVMFRGEDDDTPPLEFVASQIEEGLTEWRFISQESSGGTEPIPNASTGTLFNNRLFVPFNRDEIAVSDVLNYTRYDAVLNQFRINSGDNASLQRIFPWNTTSLVAFKTRGIYIAQNVYGDFSDTRLDEVTRELGLVARRAVATVGPDIWFLDQSGVRSLQSAVDNRLQATTEPVSAPIQPLIERITWDAVSEASAAVWDNKFYLAVPIDGSTTNNAILVYDLINQAWAGYDTGDFMDAAHLVTIRHRGQWRLSVTSSSGDVYLYEDGFADERGADEADIELTLATRGYDAGDLAPKRAVAGVVEVSTWNPDLDLSAQVEGVNETETVRTQWTRSREEYVVHGRAAYELDNANDDHGNPGREDYSVDLADVPDFDLGSGVDFELHQRARIPFTLRRRGRRVQLRLINSTGRLRLHAAEMLGIQDGKERPDT